MPFILRSSGDFVPAPEGLHEAVAVDVIDKGLCETPWGEKHKVRLVWELAVKMKDGRHFTVGKTYTASLHLKSSLTKDLVAWRGRPFTAEELKGFDVEKVIGAPCQILVQHTEKEGTVYANVATVLKAAPGTKLAPSGHYTRQMARQATGADPEGWPSEENPVVAEDPIPF